MLGVGEKYYLEAFLEKCKYGVKNAINEEWNLDKFDNESDDESDKNNYIF